MGWYLYLKGVCEWGAKVLPSDTQCDTCLQVPILPRLARRHPKRWAGILRAMDPLTAELLTNKFEEAHSAAPVSGEAHPTSAFFRDIFEPDEVCEWAQQRLLQLKAEFAETAFRRLVSSVLG